jgi:hypothetical protein
MKSIVGLGLITVLAASVAQAGTPAVLNLSVESGGSSAINVAPGEVVSYQVIGSLSNPDNQGLALFGFDACFSCNGTPEDLSEMTLPASECMDNFKLPLGITNPERDDGLGGVTGGFGGTRGVPNQVKCLTQVGGATNTIINVESNAPYPLGAVCLDIGLVPTVLAEGTLTIPADAAPGTECTVVLGSAFANVVRAGETEDDTFWAVDPVDQGTLEALTMTVIEPCASVASSSPPCDSMLSRTLGNCLFIDFNGPITDPLPGEVEVRELLDGGALGADVTADFTFTANGSALKVDNTGAPLANQTWYAVRGIGGCFDFDLQFGVVYGDANGDTRTNAFDLNSIWMNRADPAPDCSPHDINADGRVNAFDLNAAWGNRNSEDPGKPSGHFCAP